MQQRRREAFLPEAMEGLTPKALASQDRFIELVKDGTTSAPIPSAVIEAELGLSGTQVRALAAFMTMKGYEVSSRPHKPAGYWWALTYEEMMEKYAHLDSRETAIHHHKEATLRTANRLRSKLPAQERLV